MLKVMKRITSDKSWAEAQKALIHEAGYSAIWQRLNQIENNLGDAYEPEALRPIQWIDKNVQKPTEADADPWGCILLWDRHNGVKVCAWNNVQEINREPVTHWKTVPNGPEERSETP